MFKIWNKISSSNTRSQLTRSTHNIFLSNNIYSIASKECLSWQLQNKDEVQLTTTQSTSIIYLHELVHWVSSSHKKTGCKWYNSQFRIQQRWQRKTRRKIPHLKQNIEQVAVAEWLARLTAVWEDPGSNHTMDSCVYHDSCCDIQPCSTSVHAYLLLYQAVQWTGNETLSSCHWNCRESLFTTS